MVPKTSIRHLKPKRVDPRARERTLKLIKRYKDADADLKRICKEKGIEVPEMIC